LLDNTEVDQLHAPIRIAPTGGFRFTQRDSDNSERACVKTNKVDKITRLLYASNMQVSIAG